MVETVPLSVVIITKDEEKNIDRCLSSVKWADEIIVVDTNSTDRTIEIAKSHGAKVYQQPWLGFGPQKNIAVEKASHDWCLSLDADEVVTPLLQESIISTIASPKSFAYKIGRHSFYLNKIMRYGDWGKDKVVRLFNRQHHNWTNDQVHERINIKKKDAILIKGKLLHYTQQSLDASIKKTNQYSTIAAEQAYKRGKKNRLHKAFLSKYWTFFRCYILLGGFLDGYRGFVLAKLTSDGSFFKYLKLWEKHQNQASL